MRNLKRALSLGLTAAMISGLMVMGSSAVSYPDSDQIQNQTAVEILGEIGVMVGDDNGNFNPTQDVTRAEMAVIITRILYGNDLNVDQFKGMNLFTDVPAWAEGFVNLCASLDIVAGVGDGKFAPNETVTAAQAALMLSRALGYFQNNAEFGNDWALAAIRRATSAGIIGDDMVLAANEGLSRDNVAQMTFNTLTKAVPVQYNELLNVYYNENQGITYALTFNYLQTLGYTNFDLVYDNGDTTIYGRPATTWGIGSYRTTTSDKDSGSRYDEALDANGGLISSNVQILSRDEIITVANEPTYVYTDSTAEEDVYDDLGAVICNDQRGQEDDEMYTWTVYVNGEEVFTGEENWIRENSIPENNEGDEYQYTGEGAQTEIYVDDADQTVTVVEINYYLGQVSNVDEEDGTVSIREVSDLSDNNAELDDRDFATTAFEEDDYVVFTIDQNEDEDFYICEMMAPETVTGTVTEVDEDFDSSNAYLYLDDETRYDYSDEGHMVYDLNDANNMHHPELDEEYTLYLDPNGYVLAYSGDTEVGFLYVQDSDEELADWEARVVLADGIDDVVMVDDDLDDGTQATFGDKSDDIDWLNEKNFNELTGRDENGNPVVDKANLYWLDTDELGDYVNGAFEAIEYYRGATKVSDIDYQIWEYTTNDEGDLYTLTGRTTKYAAGVEINNGKAYIDNPSKPSDDILIDNSTIFVDVDANVAYTGYDEVPDISNAKIAYVLEDDNTRDVAEIVYIIDGDIYDADALYFVLTTDDRSTVTYDGDKYWKFKDMYVDGHHETGLYVACDALNAAEITPEVGEVYKVMKSIDGTYITEIVPVDNWSIVQSVSESSLWVIDQDQNKDKYATSDATYVMIEEQYDEDIDWDWFDFEWNRDRNFTVDEVTYRQVQTEVNTDDGYITLAQVVKADDGVAELVYIWRFIPLTVRVDDNNDGEPEYTEYARTWWEFDEMTDTIVVGYEAPENYAIIAATLADDSSVLDDGKIVLNINDFRNVVVERNADREFERFVLNVDVTLAPIGHGVTLAPGTLATIVNPKNPQVDVDNDITVTIEADTGYYITSVTGDENSTGNFTWKPVNDEKTIVDVTVPKGTTAVVLKVDTAKRTYAVEATDHNVSEGTVPSTVQIGDPVNFTLKAKNAGTASNGYKVYFNGIEVGTFEGGAETVPVKTELIQVVGSVDIFNAVKTANGGHVYDVNGNEIDSYTSGEEVALYKIVAAEIPAVKATAIIDKAITADMLEDANEVVVTVK